MTDLPDGWGQAAVGDIAELADGPFGSNLKTAHYTEGGPRVVRLQNIGDGVFRDERAHIAQEHYERLIKHAVRPGDIVAASLGEDAPRACLVPSWLGPAVVKADCIRVRTFDGLNSAFLMWMLNSPPVRAQAASSIKGVGRPRLGLGGLRRLAVPVPPLNEQRRIVAAIEEHFSRLDAAEQALAQAKRRVALLRTATRSHAVSGDWPVVALGQVTESQIYGSSAKAGTDPGGVPILRMGNIRDGALDFGELKYLPADHPDVEKCRLQRGDLLFNRTNSPELVGKSAVFKTGADPTVFASYLIRVRLSPECDPDWAGLVINSHLGRRYVASVRTQQVGQANVNGTKLAAMPIPLPALDEQRRVLAEVERQLSVLDAMDAQIDRSLRRSAALRRSILEQAFSGKLVPQDPTDEPASVLLERIAAERPSQPTGRRRRATAPA